MAKDFIFVGTFQYCQISLYRSISFWTCIDKIHFDPIGFISQRTNTQKMLMNEYLLYVAIKLDAFIYDIVSDSAGRNLSQIID